MIKQIEIPGQCFELYSPDDGAPGQAAHNRSSLMGEGKRRCAWS
jgi:hypothetical protein